MAICVACGRDYKGAAHNCDPKLEARIEAGYKAVSTRRENNTPSRTYNSRLRDGFALNRMCGDDK